MNEILLNVKFSLDKDAKNTLEKEINALPPLPYEKEAKENEKALDPLNEKIKEILREIESNKNRQNVLVALGKDASETQKKVALLQEELKKTTSDNLDKLDSNLEKRVTKAFSKIKVPNNVDFSKNFGFDTLNKQIGQFLPQVGKAQSSFNNLQKSLTGIASQSGVFGTLAKGALKSLNPVALLTTAVVGLAFSLRGVQSELDEAQQDLNLFLGNDQAGAVLINNMSHLAGQTKLTKIELANLASEIIDIDKTNYTIENTRKLLENTTIATKGSEKALKELPKIMKDLDREAFVTKDTLDNLQKTFGQEVASNFKDFVASGLSNVEALEKALEKSAEKGNSLGTSFKKAGSEWNNELTKVKESFSNIFSPIVDGITWIGVAGLKLFNGFISWNKKVRDSVFSTIKGVAMSISELWTMVTNWDFSNMGERFSNVWNKAFNDIEKIAQETFEKKDLFSDYEKKAKLSIEKIKKAQEELANAKSLGLDTKQAEENLKNLLKKRDSLLEEIKLNISYDTLTKQDNPAFRELAQIGKEAEKTAGAVASSLDPLSENYKKIFSEIQKSQAEIDISKRFNATKELKASQDKLNDLKKTLEEMAKIDFLNGSFSHSENGAELMNKVTSLLGKEEDIDPLTEKYQEALKAIENKKLEIEKNTSLGLEDELKVSQEELKNLKEELKNILSSDNEAGLFSDLEADSNLGGFIQKAVNEIEKGTKNTGKIAIKNITDPITESMNQLGKAMESFSTGSDFDKITGSLNLAQNAANSIGKALGDTTEKIFSSVPFMGGVIGGVNSMFQGIVALFSGVSQKKRKEIEDTYYMRIDEINQDFEREHAMREENLNKLNKQLNALDQAFSKGQLTASEFYASSNEVGSQIEEERILQAKNEKLADIDRELAQLKKDYDLEAGKWFPNKKELNQMQRDMNRLEVRKQNVQNATTLADVKAAEKGGLFTANKPTLLLVGEKGSENVSVMPTRPADIDPRLFPLNQGKRNENLTIINNVVVNGFMGDKTVVASEIKNMIQDLITLKGSENLIRGNR